MTQLFALANNHYSLLLADRRITVGGKSADDEFNKVCVLFCADARVAIAFTGLATYENFDTSAWLVDTLAEIGNQTEAIAEILAAVALRAGDKFRGIPLNDRRLTFLATGFVYWEPEPRPVAYVLSNCANTECPTDDFILRTVSPSGGSIVEVAGVTNVLPNATETSLRKLLSSNLAAASVLRFTVKQLQNLASTGKIGRLIGTQCNSALIPATPNTIVTTTYHSAFHTHIAYGPNVVITRGARFYGTEIFSSTIIAGKDIRKQDLCWCGSGQIFKHCHLKKFGSFYVRLSAFKAPMYATTFMEFEAERPSGRICHVASGYQ